MKIHHIGYLVKQISEAIATHEALGYHCITELCFDESRNVDLVFMENDSYVIELVMPKDETSVVWNMLKKRGSGPYHFCYEAEDLETAIRSFCENGFVQVTEPSPTCQILPSVPQVVFLTSRKTGLIELIEKKAIE
ncbi:MAG: VOC family protein [Clostridiales Family XIII bacterium]|jgi:methylmalonyl-CoA/ethylmalonyl-CoA epimerase|nr:VOC family protein [Clostridiales Family XIII bacterium]